MNSSEDRTHSDWAHLRQNCPVAKVDSGSEAKRPVYQVVSWAGVNQVLRDPETFSSSINAEGTSRFMGPVLLAMDGEEHRSRRLLISHAFRTSQLARWEHTLVRPAIADLCDGISNRGGAELIDEVISRFPVNVICGMCGIPAEDGPRFLQWAKDIHRGMLHPDVGTAASEAMRTYLEPIVNERRKRRGDDLISDIVHAEVDGQKLGEEEIYGFLRLLLPAGSESTFRTMATALLALLQGPGLLARAETDRSFLDAIIEETLRWDVANTMASRVATRDTKIGEYPIPSGAALRVVTSSANRDESQFADSSRFDPDRRSKRHVAFGSGPHQCLGQPLARLEMRVGLETILDKLKNLRLDPDHPTPTISGGMAFRGPDALNVLYDPA